MSQPEPSAARRQSAAGTTALLVIGLLILVPSGLCTGLLGVSALFDMIAHPQGEDYAAAIGGMALIVGGPFVIVGGMLVWFAIKRMRTNARELNR